MPVNLDDLPDEELLSLPESNIDPAQLDRFRSRRSEILEKKQAEETAPSMAATSRGQERARAENRQELEMERYVLALENFRQREDYLIAVIEERHRETLKRLQDIDDRAIKLHDGRRAYVDGDNYRDR